MKKFHSILFLISCIIFSGDIMAQSHIIKGKYSNNRNYYFNFLDQNKVDFYIGTSGCIITEYKGFGDYTIENDSLKIWTKFPESYTKPYQNQHALAHKHQVELHIFDQNKTPNSLVILYNKSSNKIVLSKGNNEEGFVAISNIDTSAVDELGLIIKSFGYSDIVIPLNQVIGQSVKINLNSFYTLNNELVTFPITIFSDSLLLSTYTIPEKEITTTNKKERRRIKRNRRISKAHHQHSAKRLIFRLEKEE
ncbi:MAG: hypothetical protein ACPGSD_16045 [Flavobacteriales bacterium]